MERAATIRVGATGPCRVALALVTTTVTLASPGCDRLRALSTARTRGADAGIATMIRTLDRARPSPAAYAVGASRFTVELGLERPTMMVHEPALLSLVFRVPAGLEVELFATPTDGLFRPDHHAAAFVDADGRALPQSAERGDGNGTSGWLPVEGSRTERLIASSWVVGLTPGAYRFHVETTVRARAGVSDPWRAVPVAIDAPITVVPDDPAALAAIVRTAATSSDDLDRAGYLTDALREASAGQIRYAAIVALSQSPCAAAYPALLAHHNDADYAVRLTVLQRIARDPRPAVIPQLESFLRDPNDVVRGEAQRRVADHHR